MYTQSWANPPKHTSNLSFRARAVITERERGLWGGGGGGFDLRNFDRRGGGVRGGGNLEQEAMRFLHPVGELAQAVGGGAEQRPTASTSSARARATTSFTSVQYQWASCSR